MSSQRPDKAGTGSPEKSRSTTGGGSARKIGNEQGATQRTHEHGRPGESGSTGRGEERRPESERLRASDGPAEAARAHARERFPYRDGPAAQDPERAIEQVRQTEVKEQRDLERIVRKDIE